ncbi:MAG: hypothetical protein AB3N14_07875 [Flavobacteriaceae bacterium]
MKKLLYIILGCIVTLYSCSSQKKLEVSTPFTLGASSCQEWVGGKEESGKGQLVKIAISEMKGEKVAFQNIYFRGQMAKVTMEMEDEGMIATAKFFDQKKPDIIMHADATKEVGNQPPRQKPLGEKEFPFELKETEAVLSYLEDEKVKYVKIVGIIEKPSRIYPSRPQN